MEGTRAAAREYDMVPMLVGASLALVLLLSLFLFIVAEIQLVLFQLLINRSWRETG